jgi:DNA-binding MarR family transcriptional regulator
MQDPVEAFLWENRRLFRSAATAADRALAPLRIDAGQRALLEFLAREPRPVSLSALARKRSVSRQHIHQSLARLRERDWVDRLPDPEDSRSVLLRLSDSGRRFWKQVRTVDRGLLQRVRRHVSGVELERASQTVRKVRRLLEEIEKS